MDAHDANVETTQGTKSQVAADGCTDARGTDCDACSKRDRFVNYQRQRSIEYDEIVASCVGYTLCCPGKEEEDQSGPIFDGDIVQIISSWSTANDGVIQVDEGGKVAASGTINQEDKKAYFRCRGILSDEKGDKWMKMRTLTPRSSGKSNSTDCGQEFLGIDDKRNVVIIKEINAISNNILKKKTGWFFERATEHSASRTCSVSRDWRLRLVWDESDKSDAYYLSADRSGALSLHKEEVLDCPDEGFCRNPQTYFYLYKKSQGNSD